MNSTFRFIAILFSMLIAFYACDNPSSPGAETHEGEIQTGGISYKVNTIDKTIGSCDADTGCLRLSFSILEWENLPVNFNDKQLLKWTNERMFSFWQTDTVYSGMDALLNTVIKEYANLAKDSSDRIEWVFERNMEVIENNKAYFTLLFSETSYAGGAHPNSFEFYKSFNTATGQPNRLEEMFTPMFETQLTKMAEGIFRAQKKITPTEDLEKAGYWFDNGEFKLPLKNYCLTANGLLFHYNSYEIAPYAEGSTTIVIPWDKLVKLMKEEKMSDYLSHV